MKLFLISVSTYDYDEYDAFIVRAEDEAGARRSAAAAAAYGEQKKSFLDPSLSTVSEVTAEGEEGVILASFNAG